MAKNSKVAKVATKTVASKKEVTKEVANLASSKKDANKIIGKKSKWANLEEKRKMLTNPKLYDFMGLTECHGKMFYRYREIGTGKINHLIIEELTLKGQEI